MTCLPAARTADTAYMPVILWDALLLLISVLLTRETVHGCEQGWFGHNCKLKCHCRSSVACLPDGQCLGGEPCDPRYFGPACQYADLAFQQATLDTSGKMKDGDDETCNSDPHATSVSLTLNTSIHMSWFRIHTNNFAHLLSFTVKINKAPSCKNEKRFIQAEREVDVVCSEPVLLTELQVVGDIAPSVCSIYISADVLCSRGTFGVDCQERCTCDSADNCHPVTGVCAHTCLSGKYGLDCSLNCSNACYHKICSPDSGACYQCSPGMTGDYCDVGFFKRVQSNRSPLWLILPLILFLLLFIIGVYMCRQQRQKQLEVGEAESFVTTTYRT